MVASTRNKWRALERFRRAPRVCGAGNWGCFGNRCSETPPKKRPLELRMIPPSPLSRPSETPLPGRPTFGLFPALFPSFPPFPIPIFHPEPSSQGSAALLGASFELKALFPSSPFSSLSAPAGTPPAPLGHKSRSRLPTWRRKSRNTSGRTPGCSAGRSGTGC